LRTVIGSYATTSSTSAGSSTSKSGESGTAESSGWYKTDEKVIELAKKTLRTIYQQAVAMESDPLRKWATRSHGSQSL
jgi:hypothetical protein